MPVYCTKCNINWARLHSQDCDDETYEYCPKCKSDWFLEEGMPGPQYISPAIGCGVFDIVTKQELITTKVLIAPPMRGVPFNMDAYREKMKTNEEIRISAIDAYTSLFSTAGRAAAEEEYFKILKTQS